MQEITDKDIIMSSGARCEVCNHYKDCRCRCYAVAVKTKPQDWCGAFQGQPQPYNFDNYNPAPHK